MKHMLPRISPGRPCSSLLRSRPQSPASRLAAFLFAVLAAACGEGNNGSTATVTDSAGVQIVTSSAPAWDEGEGWTVDSVPSLDIGGSDTDPHYDLLQVSGAVTLGDGHIAVLTSGTRNIQFYDSDGTWISSSGRDGEGPGEFRSPFVLVKGPGDTLYVYDYDLRRMSRIAADGSFLPPLPANDGQSGFVLPFARLADGSWVATGLTFGSDAMSGAVRPSEPLVHLGADLGLLDTALVMPGTESWITTGKSVDGRRTIGMRLLPLGLSSSFAVSDSLIFAGDQVRYEVGMYRPDGTLVRSIRRTGGRQKVTDAMLERLKENALANARDRDKALADWEQLPKPSELPAFGEISLDADGNLWVSRPTVLSSDTTIADVFDPDGRWLGPVTLPPSFRPSEIGHDYMLGVWKDEVGLAHVRRYSIGGRTDRRADGQ